MPLFSTIHLMLALHKFKVNVEVDHHHVEAKMSVKYL